MMMDAHPVQMVKRSLLAASTQTMEKSKSAGHIRKPVSEQRAQSSKAGTPRRRRLPSLKERYGAGVTSTWQKGPIDMPKVSMRIIG
jgi:hypothetical protein